MKKARIINAAAWVVVAITLCTAVAIQWSANNAPVKSLVLGAMFYTSFAILFGWLIDEKIRRVSK